MTDRRLSWETSSATENVIDEPPVKSMPGFRPGAMMRKITPGKSTKADTAKNHLRFPTKSTSLLLDCSRSSRRGDLRPLRLHLKLRETLALRRNEPPQPSPNPAQSRDAEQCPADDDG